MLFINLSTALIPSSQILSKHWSWIHHLMNLIPLLLLSLQVSCPQLVPFLIIINNSLFLVSHVINYGARLVHNYFLFLWQAKCQPLTLSSIFQVIHHHLDSRLSYHQITSFWMQLIRLTSLADFETAIGEVGYATCKIEQPFLIPVSKTAIGDTVTMKDSWHRGYPSFRSTWFTFQDAGHSGQGSLPRVGNTTHNLASLINTAKTFSCAIPITLL